MEMSASGSLIEQQYFRSVLEPRMTAWLARIVLTSFPYLHKHGCSLFAGSNLSEVHYAGASHN